MGIIDIDGIMSAFDKAWAEEIEVTGAALEQSIDGNYYAWPNLTRRLNGQTVSSPRNIVDTGGLQSSQYKATITPAETEFGWTAPHAELNHNGGMASYNGHTYYHTARPWTQVAISGDSFAPLEYQRADALLNVPEDFTRRLDRHLATLQDGAETA